MPSLTWYGSPNFTPGRVDVEYVVIHWMDGYLAGADATFQNTTRQTSAHYGVEDDTIHQYVDEANTAWHAGNYDANTRSIGIEHSAMPGRPASDATYASTIWLITGICQRYGLDPAVAILPHQHFTSTDCPGTMDLPRIIAGVQAALGGVSTQSGTITPIQEDFMATLSDAEKQVLMDAAARINGFLVQRYDGNKQPARALDTLDGNQIRADIAASTARAVAETSSAFHQLQPGLIAIAAGVGSLKSQPAAAVPAIDVPALAAQIAAALNTTQAHDFLVAFRNALPAN